MSVKVNYNIQSQVLGFKNALSTTIFFLEQIELCGYLYLFDVVHVYYFVRADEKKTFEQRLALRLFYKLVHLQPQ